MFEKNVHDEILIGRFHESAKVESSTHQLELTIESYSDVKMGPLWVSLPGHIVILAKCSFDFMVKFVVFSS